MFGMSKIKVLSVDLRGPRQARFWLSGVVSLGLSAAVSTLALAQSAPAAPAASAPAGPAKIGIVYIQEAIFATNEGKKETDTLQAKFSPKQTELKTQSDEVENLKKQFEAQQAKLSADASATQARSIEAKQKNFQRHLEDAQ